MENKNQLTVSSSPQIHARTSTSQVMWSVTASLVPAGAWGVYVFGWRALLVVLVSIAAAVVAEFLLTRIQGKLTVGDGSAVVTGLLIGYNMPVDVPLYIPIFASLFAIFVVKWSFGGLGANWMNPALAGRVFVFFSWTGAMTTWRWPATLAPDAVSVATPLGALKSGLIGYEGAARSPLALLNEQGLPGSRYMDMFIGNIPGCIGEVSALLLLVGALFLFAKKIITWEVPVAYLGSFALLVWVFGGTRYGGGLFQGDVLFHLLTGGLMLGAFFMATDMVTSPLTRKGMLIFGIGCGFLTFLIRFFGSFPEGVSLAIIVMNIFVPAINRFTKPRRFGVVKEEKA